MRVLPAAATGPGRPGVTLAGRLVAAHGERVAFDDSAPANLAAGDAFAAQIRAMLDQVIRRAGLDAPPVEPDDADTPVELSPPMALDLGTVPVGSVVWCTGYTGDFSWLPPALDAVVTHLMVTVGGGR